MEVYRMQQHSFDRFYAKLKCKYEREKIAVIERCNTNNPNEFWKHIKNLGPARKKADIPMEVYGPDGQNSKACLKVMMRMVLIILSMNQS